MDCGSPTVDLVLQFLYIWGTSWTHQHTVPMVPSTLAAGGIEVCGAMVGWVVE
jgi:hypothetical protein